MAQNPKKNKPLAPSVDTGYNKTKENSGTYTGSSTGFESAKSPIAKPVQNKTKTTVYYPDGTYEQKTSNPTSYWSEAQKARDKLYNRSLPRKEKVKTTVKTASAPQNSKSVVQSTISKDEKTITNQYAKKYNLPNWEERNFAMGAFGIKEEKLAYQRALDDILNPKSPKTQDELFREGFYGKEENPVEKRNFQVDFGIGKIEEPQSPHMRAFAKEQAKVNKLRDDAAKFVDPNVKFIATPDNATSVEPPKEEKSFWEAPKEIINDIWENTKETAGEFWEDTKEIANNVWDFSKETAKNLANGASSWANEKGFLDDATNAFFKASDYLQNLPEVINPTRGLHQSIADENYIANQKIDLSIYDADGGYINDQNITGSQSGKIRYGNGAFNDNGCEIIAVNNALVSLGNRKDVRDIAKDFETDGQTAFGYFGTSPFAIGDYFVRQGYRVETFTGDKEIYNLDIPDADTYIVSFWNSDKITSMIHTVSMDKLPNGKYRIYNEGGKRIVDIDSLNKYLTEKNRVPIVLHCIKKGR